MVLEINSFQTPFNLRLETQGSSQTSFDLANAIINSQNRPHFHHQRGLAHLIVVETQVQLPPSPMIVAGAVVHGGCIVRLMERVQHAMITNSNLLTWTSQQGGVIGLSPLGPLNHLSYTTISHTPPMTNKENESLAILGPLSVLPIHHAFGCVLDSEGPFPISLRAPPIFGFLWLNKNQ